MNWVRKSSDGRYGLTPRDEHHYHQLCRITGPLADMEPGYPGYYVVGLVADPENLYSAIEEAEEEARVLMAQAREEFGYG